MDKVPWGKVPRGKVPWGKLPWCKGPWGKGPWCKGPWGKGPYCKVPRGKLPRGKLPRGNLPWDKVPRGKVPRGKVPWGKLPWGKVPWDKVPRGKVPRGKLPWDKVPWGKVPRGKLPWGKVDYVEGVRVHLCMHPKTIPLELYSHKPQMCSSSSILFSCTAEPFTFLRVQRALALAPLCACWGYRDKKPRDINQGLGSLFINLHAALCAAKECDIFTMVIYLLMHNILLKGALFIRIMDTVSSLTGKNEGACA